MKLFRLTKKGILALAILLVILISSVFIAPRVYSYYQAFRLERQADILLVQSQYKEALKKYKDSREKWEDVEINKKIEKAETVWESEKSYQDGLEAFDNEEYKEAINAFLKVDSEHKDYDKAWNFIGEAKEKLNEEKKEFLSVNL